MVRFPIYHEDPRIQARMEEADARIDFNRKNNILVTPLRTEKEIYDKVLEIYKIETGDDNLYMSNTTYDMNGTLILNKYAIKYKEHNEDLSRFWEIYNVLEYKEIMTKYKKDDKINLYVKVRDTNNEWTGHENITGELIENNDQYIKVKSKKNGESLIIKYIDILLIDEDDNI